METLLPDIKTDVVLQGKQLSSCCNIKDKSEFPQKHDLVYMLNVLAKVVMMTMITKRQDVSLKGWYITVVEITIFIF